MTEPKDNLNLIEKITFALGLTTTNVIQYFQTGGNGVEINRLPGKGKLLIVVDPKSKQEEIFKENNEAVIE